MTHNEPRIGKIYPLQVTEEAKAKAFLVTTFEVRALPSGDLIQERSQLSPNGKRSIAGTESERP